MAGPEVDAFAASLGISLDDWQRRSLETLRSGRSVVTIAPTGAGKTVVALYALALATAAGRRGIYTVPLRALSRQKYGELRSFMHGAAVGLINGAEEINRDAQVLVTTTEVFRAMARRGDVSEAGVVVFDECHFVGDAGRGPVWEEAMLRVGVGTRLVGLSATLGAVETFRSWLESLGHDVAAVVESRRPVPLRVRAIDADRGVARLRSGAAGGIEGGLDSRPAPGSIADALRGADLLPALVFRFSRQACDDGAIACMEQTEPLLGRRDQAKVGEIVDHVTRGIDLADFDVLGVESWARLLRHGVAVHHAGQLPQLRLGTEAALERGLARLVFATGTLANGIHLPVRCVVVERLRTVGHNGERLMAVNEFQQLTGRAGRRGLDDSGVVAVGRADVDQAVRLLNANGESLRSAFRVSYGLVASLIAEGSREDARRLIGRSFRSFLERRQAELAQRELDRLDHEIAVAAVDSRCTTCDDDARRAPRDGVRDTGQETLALSIDRLRPDDIVLVVARARTYHARVIEVPSRRKGLSRVLVEDATRTRVALASSQLRQPVIRLREEAARSDPRDLAARLGALDETLVQDGSCPYAAEHLRARDELRMLTARREQVSNDERSLRDVEGDFESALRILQHVGAVNGWRLRAAGDLLRSVYDPHDLALVLAHEASVFAGLAPAELAAVASSCASVGQGLERPDAPEDRVARAVGALQLELDGLHAIEEAWDRERTASIDPGPCAAIREFAEGGSARGLVEALGGQAGRAVEALDRTDHVLVQLEALGGSIEPAARAARRLLNKAPLSTRLVKPR